MVQLQLVCSMVHIGTSNNSFIIQSPLAVPEQADIIDETLDLFRANSLFRNFEIKGPADRLLIVLILFISDCLAVLPRPCHFACIGSNLRFHLDG